MIFQFRVFDDVYEIEADNWLQAMGICNRQVMDGLNLGPFSWDGGEVSGNTSFYCALGNNFD